MQDTLLDKQGGSGIVLADIVTYYSCLNKLWSSAYDGYDFHFSCSRSNGAERLID